MKAYIILYCLHTYILLYTAHKYISKVYKIEIPEFIYISTRSYTILYIPKDTCFRAQATNYKRLYHSALFPTMCTQCTLAGQQILL